MARRCPKVVVVPEHAAADVEDREELLPMRLFIPGALEGLDAAARPEGDPHIRVDVLEQPLLVARANGLHHLAAKCGECLVFVPFVSWDELGPGDKRRRLGRRRSGARDEKQKERPLHTVILSPWGFFVSRSATW